jgi:hypothetical protein
MEPLLTRCCRTTTTAPIPYIIEDAIRLAELLAGTSPGELDAILGHHVPAWTRPEDPPELMGDHTF